MNNSVTQALLQSNFIHIPQSTAPELVQLSEGLLLRATVQRVTDEMALLNLNGTTISVKTDVPLQPQQRVTLQVSQVGPQQVSLQIVQGAAADSAAQPAAVLPETAQTGLQLLLESWGIEPDATNQAIAKALFTHTQSMNPNDIQDVRLQWQQFSGMPAAAANGNSAAANLEALVYLHQNRLPINAEAVNLARQLLTNMQQAQPVAQHLSSLQSSLQNAQQQLQTALAQANQPASQLTYQANGQLAAQPANQAAAQLTTLLNNVNNTLAQMSNWTISANMPPEQLAARLTEVVIRLGTPPEAQLANQLVNQPTSQPATQPNGQSVIQPNGQPAIQPNGQPASNGQTAPAAAAAPGSSGATGAQPNSQSAPANVTAESVGQPASHSNTTSVNQPASQPTHQPTQPLPDSTAPLERLSAAIKTALAQPEIHEATKLVLRELSHQIETVSRDLGAIQMSNMAQTPPAAGEPYYMFPIPLHTEAGPRTAQLRVYRRSDGSNGTQPLDPDNLRLALLLDMPGLGEIAVDLTVFNKRLSGKFISGRQSTHQLVQAELGDLQRSLQKLGYTVDGLFADMLSPEKPSIFEPSEPAHGIEVPLAQVDLAV